MAKFDENVNLIRKQEVRILNFLGTRKNREPYWYIAPAFIITMGVLILPLTYAVVISFLRWNLTRPDLKIIWVGITNYIKNLSSPRFQDAAIVTLCYTVALVISQLIIGFGFALLLQCKFWGRGVIRSLIILPMVIAPVVAGLIFRSLFFNTSFGYINYFLSLLGIDPVYWLSEIWTARFAVFITSLWLGVPFTMLILLSGLESLPISIYEAAQIDGTTPIQSFFLITIPLLKRTILVATIFQTISSLRLFDVPWIVTAGGPGISNLTMSILAYKESMMLFRMGSGASQAMIILIITFIFAAGYINMMKEDIDF